MLLLIAACGSPPVSPASGGSVQPEPVPLTTPSDSLPSTPTPEPTTTTSSTPTTADPWVEIRPETPHDHQALSCSAAEGMSVQWEVDGAPVGLGPIVPTGRVRSGEQWACVATGLAEELRTEVTITPWGGNLLVVLLDDVGVDKVAVYAEHPQPPRTPILDALAAEGLRFTRAYAHPFCSSTRSTALTGRHPSRTGIGYVVDTLLEDQVELSLSETTLAEVLGAHGYATAAFGKWHLAGWPGPSGLQHPMLQGFTHFQGSPGNLNRPLIVPMGGYRLWDKNDRGVLVAHERYATTDTVDDALAHLDGLPEPWLMWVAFNAGHSPYHAPPEELAEVDGSGTADLYDAMITAMDVELGRLLDGLPPRVAARTTIVVMGDNGTPQEATREPWDGDRAKGTLFEAGVRVPLLVTGPMVEAPGVSDALVHAADLFGLASDLVGAPLADDVDAVSPLAVLVDPTLPGDRDHVWFERFFPIGAGPYITEYQGVSDGAHKLVRLDGVEAFYVLDGHDDGAPVDPEALTGAAAVAHARLAALLADYDALEVE
ncbi:MAG: arylsulfatase B [Myxococcota bacterium]|jgi:arylsulfatase B